MAVDVLGPLRVRDVVTGDDRTPAGELQRRLLALLVLERGRIVSADRAVEALWPSRPPRDPGAALQTHVFRLRQSLPAGLVASTGTGYRLDPDAIDLDAERLAAAALAAAAAGPTGLPDALDALARWRGHPYSELDELPEAALEAARLEEVRATLVEAAAAAHLAQGRAGDALAAASDLVARLPLRERPVELAMDALVALGRRAEALRAYDAFRRRLAAELGIEPSSLLVARHAQLLAGGAAPAPPVGGFPPHRLPAAVTSIVGRDELVETAIELIERHRLVTMLGPGGVGKTRLSLEVGRRLRDARPERPVVFCALAASEPSSAVDAVAAALTLDGRTGTSLAERIAHVLAGVECILVLDNCEHVLDPVAELVELVLAAAPGVTVIATTRERLRVAGEQLCPVPPLPLVGDGGPAGALFLERARAVVPGWSPDGPERAQIEDIVRRLDGLPLAIELAAARLHTLSVAEITRGLDRRFRLLSSGSRTAARHRSLGAAIAWSSDLLDDERRAVFAALSVFAGPFRVDDVAAVADLDPLAAADAVEALTERSLVLRLPDGRSTLLDSLRAYGAELLSASGAAAAVAGRHADHQLDRVVRARARLGRPDGATAIAETDAALPELAAALGHLLDAGEVERAGRLLLELDAWGFLRLRPDVLAWSERVLAADPRDTSPAASSVWALSAEAAWLLGDLEAMSVRIERSLALGAARPGGPPADVLDTFASLALFEGRLDDARRLLADALRSVGPDDTSRRLTVVGEQVLAHAYAGDIDAARETAAGLLAEVGDTVSPLGAFAWYCAGEAELGRDDDRARALLGRAVDVAERTDASFVVGIAGASLASLEARDGDVAVAVAAYRGLLDHWHRAGVWATQWPMLRSVGALLRRMGQDRDAAVLVAAVRHTSLGHRLYGADAVAMARLDDELRDRLGASVHAAARAEGRALDGDAAVEHALRSLRG